MDNSITASPQRSGEHSECTPEDHLNKPQFDRPMDEQDYEIARLKKIVIQYKEEAAKNAQEFAEQRKRITALDRQVAALLSSISWRITRPIRGLKGILNAMRQKNLLTVEMTSSPEGTPASVGLPCVTDKGDQPLAQLENNPVLSFALPKAGIRTDVNPLPLQTGSSENASPVISWEDDLHLKIDDVNFRLTWDSAELTYGISTIDDFLLGKARPMVEKLAEMQQRQKITKIFEMGILKGGSVALHDRIFRPLKIAAIEYMPEPVPALTEYILKYDGHTRVKPYYGISQADRPAMENILSAEFPERDIDLIVDDASHLYEETRDAFNITFPYLAPGGTYIIEDWAWAHWTGDAWQSKNSFFYGKTALSNLLIELFMLAASRPDFITNIEIAHSTILIKKGQGVVPAKNFRIADHYLLRGKRFGAWL